jgi:hypothetical protein
MLYVLAGVSLTPWWTTEQQRHLTVGHGLLGQIVVDHDGVLAIVSEVSLKLVSMPAHHL